MKPYVYIIQNLEKTHWYVGYKQKPKAGEEYWGSSDYLDELIAQTGKENWTKTIVAEFDTWQEAKAHEDELLELMWDWPGRVNKNINGYVDYTDPEVKAKQKVGCQKNAQNPEYLAKNKAANQKRAKPFIATRITTGEEYFCEKLSCDQAKELKLGQGAVSDCLNGKSKQHKGFTFRYV